MGEDPVQGLLARVTGSADDGRGCHGRLLCRFARSYAVRSLRIAWEQEESGCYAAPAVERVLVLNASYEPLNVCSLRRAHVLVWKGKAEILESHERPLRSATTNFSRPNVIRLKTYVRVPRGVTRRISRRVLFARDGWQCAYCGSGSNRLTLDHVVPRLPRRHLRLGERRHLVRAVQPQQGRPPARGDEHEAPYDSPAPDTGALHPPDDGVRSRTSGARTCLARSCRGLAGVPRLYLDIARSTASCSSGESATDERPRSRSLT